MMTEALQVGRPKLPLTPVPGQYLFFVDPKQGNRIVLYGKVVGTVGQSRGKIKLSNATGFMTYNIKDGTARPNFNVLNCVWAAGAEMTGLPYNEQLELAVQQMRESA